MRSSSNYALLERCNATELYQIGRRQQLNFLPGTSREVMIQTIIGEDEPSTESHPVDAWRMGIMSFLIEHREQVQSLLTCPAQSMDPHACFGCPDSQVLSCIVQNPRDEEPIAARRHPPRAEESTMQEAATSLTIENAPEDREVLEKKGSWRLQRLAMDLVKAPLPPGVTKTADGWDTYLPALTGNPTTDEEVRIRSAMLTGKSEELAPIILGALKRWDSDHPGQSARTLNKAVDKPGPRVERPKAEREQLVLPTGPTSQRIIPPLSALNQNEEEDRPAPRMPKPAASPAAVSKEAGGQLFQELTEAIDHNTAAIDRLATTVTRLYQLCEMMGAVVDRMGGVLDPTALLLEQVATLQAGTLKIQPLIVTLLLGLSEKVLETDPSTIATMALHQSAHLDEFFPEGTSTGKE